MPGGGFSLAFPSTPSGETTNQSSGSLTMQVHKLVSEDGSAAFGAVFTDYSDEPADPVAALGSVVQDIVISNGGTLVEDQPVTAGGLSGRELTVSVPKSASRPAYEIHARIFLRAQRYYAITAILKGSGGGAASNVDPFLDSFALDPP